MKLFLALLAGAIASAQITPVVNVNSRYVVESIEVSGHDEFNLSRSLHEEIQNLVGEYFDQSALDDLTGRIKKELHAKSVSYRISRGDQPEQVKVNFEITRRSVELNVTVPKFLYHSTQGWTGVVEGVASSGSNSVTFRLLSDDDELVERETGILARYDRKRVGSDRVGLGFQFEGYHQGWSRSTLLAEDQRLDGAPPVPNDVLSAYRTRQNFQPIVTIQLAKPLTLEAGASFERFQDQFPAARTESTNAMVNTLRYHRLLEGSDAHKQALDAGYSLRAATKILSSDFAYVRHHWNVAYTFTRDHNTVLVSFVGGVITGQAPLFERFVLGNSSTLRGWNKYDIDPLGGNRVAHGSVEYRYRYFQIFYDAGAVWDRSEGATPRCSAGIGLRKDGFSVALAFPIKDGRVEPVLIAGMNF
jgi:Omp85 superfamily domain